MLAMAEEDKNRGQVRVYLSGTAKVEVERVASRIGISQTELLSRICEWFASQTKGEQLRALGILDENEDVSEKAKINARRTA